MLNQYNIAELENLRYKVWSKNRLLYIFVIICKVLFWCCAVILCYGVFLNLQSLYASIIFAFAFLIAAGSIDTCRYSQLLKYKKEIKQKVYKLLFSGSSDFKYITMDEDEVSKFFEKMQRLNFLGSFTKLVCDDCFLYKSNDISFKIYDIGIYNIATGYKTKITQKIFEGMLIVAPSFKNFSGVTLIKANKKLKFAADISSMYERVNFEDNLFEESFDVYSSNQIEARYLLTTAFMERLMKAMSKERRQIIGSFEDGNVFIGVQDCKDLFELDLSKPLTDEETFTQLFSELKRAVELVEALKLKNKIGL